jgi:mannose-1-phosphate guanylyltransferase
LAQVSLGAAATLIEPAARNTVPAVLAAALWLAERWPYALMTVSPADHVIPQKMRAPRRFS